MADLRLSNYVNQGGTGRDTHTAYAVICGGTSATAEQQSIASVGTATQVLTSNGAGALPTFQDAAGGVAGPVSSTDKALARWNGTGGDTLQDSTVIVTDAGEMTNASQPCCLATYGATGSNQTGDGTVVDVIFATEIFDQNADYNNTTGVFTAPVTGHYLITGSVWFSNVGAAHTAAQTKIVASNRTLPASQYNPTASASAGIVGFSFSGIVDMDASDTVKITAAVFNGTKVVQLYTSSFLSVKLEC